MAVNPDPRRAPGDPTGPKARPRFTLAGKCYVVIEADEYELLLALAGRAEAEFDRPGAADRAKPLSPAMRRKLEYAKRNKADRARDRARAKAHVAELRKHGRLRRTL